VKEKRILNVLGQVDEKYIVEATPVKRKAKKSGLVKWGAIAACLALVLAIGIPYLSDVIENKGGPGQIDPLRPLGAIEFNGAYYEIVKTSNTEKLDDYNLPHEITSEMVGVKLGSGLDADGKQTKTEFYLYAPYAKVSTTEANGEQRSQRAVFIASDGSEYSFALFCGFISYGEGTNYEAKEMFAVYGVYGAEDISVIEIGNKELTDPGEIKEIVDAFYNASPNRNQKYQKEVDGVADVKIITKEGLAIRGIQYSAETSSVYWGLTVYKLSVPIQYD